MKAFGLSMILAGVALWYTYHDMRGNSNDIIAEDRGRLERFVNWRVEYTIVSVSSILLAGAGLGLLTYKGKGISHSGS